MEFDRQSFDTIRGAVLGRPITGSCDVSAADEYRYISRTGDLVGVLRSWVSSDEFLVTWAGNPMFRRAQGLEPETSRDRRPVIHVHIPKTAGFTLNSVLSEHFAPVDHFIHRPLEQLLAMPVGRLRQMGFIAGHYGQTAVNLMREADPIVVAVVRNPSEHLASCWRYRIKEGRLDPSITFREWLRTTPEADNFQCRYLTATFLADPLRDRWGDGIIPAWSRARLEDEMWAAVDGLDVLGVSERVADVYRATCIAAGLVPREFTEFPRLNTTAPLAIDDDSAGLIGELTALDRSLYEMALRRGV